MQVTIAFIQVKKTFELYYKTVGSYLREILSESTSQYTVVAQEYTEMVLQCPVGEIIQLLTSEFFCATNYNTTVYRNTTSVAQRCNGKAGICSFFLDSSVQRWPSFSCDEVNTISPKVLLVTYRCT